MRHVKVVVVVFYNCDLMKELGDVENWINVVTYDLNEIIDKIEDAKSDKSIDSTSQD